MGMSVFLETAYEKIYKCAKNGCKGNSSPEMFITFVFSYSYCSTHIFHFNFRTHLSTLEALIKSRKQRTFDMEKFGRKKGDVRVILASSITYFSLKTCRNMKLEKKLDRAVNVH